MPNPPGAMAGAFVWRLSTRWRAAVDRAVSVHGLTHATYVVLTTLYSLRGAARPADGPSSPSQRALADASGMEPMYVSRLIRSLESDGLVVRTRDERDTRIVRLNITDRGLSVVRPAMRTVQALLDQLLAPLGGRDSTRTVEFVATLTELLNAPLDLGATDA
ncbi:MarR family transcriptional regulator [Agromyces sp. ISL-38]|uniref:MarR family winged helix-turn-helix transcriptional regulator n=1 Tax=Agromyces sp. ISL-38 TaxID=2819107 RepID=UPI001BE55A9E|nr:MarR family transcriptional regulator [Agromyces sp. ISL-38]MBT2499367.1 MarR family transcriptional regulator [Agromyces sp. ISL-38]MBT2518097.1 MarR family transcriptional regulator [Streptomyces sp. ISL-90]